jgi:hypothetical protein
VQSLQIGTRENGTDVVTNGVVSFFYSTLIHSVSTYADNTTWFVTFDPLYVYHDLFKFLPLPRKVLTQLQYLVHCYNQLGGDTRKTNHPTALLPTIRFGLSPREAKFNEQQACL